MKSLIQKMYYILDALRELFLPSWLSITLFITLILKTILSKFIYIEQTSVPIKGLYKGFLSHPKTIHSDNEVVLIHISDLHVPQKYPHRKLDLIEQLENTIWSVGLEKWSSEYEAIYHKLVYLISSLRPDAIIVSGDLVEKSPHIFQFRSAARFLTDLYQEVSAKCRCEVPIWFVFGNHDTKFRGNDWILLRFTLLLSIASIFVLFQPFASAINFVIISILLVNIAIELGLQIVNSIASIMTINLIKYFELEIQKYSSRLNIVNHADIESTVNNVEKKCFEKDNKAIRLELYGFDSSISALGPGFATGRIPPATLKNKLPKKSKGTVRVAIVHHHPLPIINTSDEFSEPGMLLVNSGSFLRYCAINEVDIILHGHRHVPEIKIIQWKNHSMHIVGAGSLFNHSIERSGERRSINVINITRNSEGDIKIMNDKVMIENQILGK